MKVTYNVSFNMSAPVELARELPMPTTSFQAHGSIDCTQDEYLACLKATTEAATLAADAWRPVAVDIVKSMFPSTFKEFCTEGWKRAKALLNE